MTGTGLGHRDGMAGAGARAWRGKAGAITGTVWLSTVYTGIECEGGEQGDLGCSVRDVPLNGVSSLIIGGGVGGPSIIVGISAGDNTNISLKSAPLIGWGPPGPSLLGCVR